MPRFRILPLLATALLASALTGFAVQPARANDAALQLAGGGARVMSGEEAGIRMAAETVSVELREKDVLVDVEFRFENPGDARTLEVGFPMFGRGFYAPGYFLGVPPFPSFETWIDGAPAEFVETSGEASLEGSGVTLPEMVARTAAGDESLGGAVFAKETRWLVKEVPFRAKGATRTRVRYVAPYHDFAEAKIACYLYGTGASWAGNIGRIVLRARKVGVADCPEPERAGLPKIEFRLSNEKAKFSGEERREGEWLVREMRDVEPGPTDEFEINLVYVE